MSTSDASTKGANPNSMTRSPSESPRGSFMSQQVPAGTRRYSMNLSPEIIQQLEQRRASLEKLQIEKISPWMHLYDFTVSGEN